MSLAKPISDFFLKPGILGYFAVASGAHAVSSSANAALTLGQGASTLDPNTFENTGYAAGGAVMAGGELALNAGFLRHAITRDGGLNALRYGGKHYTHLKDGGLALEGGTTRIAKELEESVLKNGTKGIYKAKHGFLSSAMGGRTFMKNWGMVRGLGLVAAPIVVGMAASSVLGFAGKIVDHAWQEHRKSKEMNYDNRFFDTSRYDMSSYQAMGAAYQSLDRVKMSMARIYHSR